MIKTVLAPALAVLMMLSTPAFAVTAGDMAPDFTASDSKGTAHTLSSYRGKYVVLEWTNHECPYVQKHYSTGNMQALQQRAADAEMIWLSVLSSAPGKQGYADAAGVEKIRADMGDKSTARVLDPTGEIGQKYGAKTTPHMFMIDPAGKILYAGAIDSDSSSDPATIATATNYIAEVMNAIQNETPITVTQTTPYGCSVKY